MQYIHVESFGYLNLGRNMLIYLTDVYTRVAASHTGIIHLQVDVDKIYTYLKALVTHAITPILIAPLY